MYLKMDGDIFSLSEFTQGSPVLSRIHTQLSPPIYNTRRSPVISTIRTSYSFGQVKKNVFKNATLGNETDSSDIFCSQESVMSDKPIFHDNSSSDDEETLIEQFSSQDCTKVEMSHVNNLYYNPVKRRKRHKGLAHQLHKTVELQRSRQTFWKHEMSFDKCVNKDFYKFRVTLCWQEYGNVMCDCSDTKILLIINSSLITKDDVPKCSDFSCILYKPFSSREICFRNKSYKCLFNISKFIFLKEVN